MEDVSWCGYRLWSLVSVVFHVLVLSISHRDGVELRRQYCLYYGTEVRGLGSVYCRRALGGGLFNGDDMGCWVLARLSTPFLA